MTDKDKERFFKFVRKDKSGCWLWTGAIKGGGYGHFRLSSCRKNMSAHRFSYTAFCGGIPDGLCVCHACDVKTCVNPGHLWLGTRDENNKDMARKGRAATGDRNGSRLHPECMARGDRHWSITHPEKLSRGVNASGAKLNDEKVVEIREQWAKGLSQYLLARKFGVTQPRISKIVHRKIWKHVA